MWILWRRYCPDLWQKRFTKKSTFEGIFIKNYRRSDKETPVFYGNFDEFFMLTHVNKKIFVLKLQVIVLLTRKDTDILWFSCFIYDL